MKRVLALAFVFAALSASSSRAAQPINLRVSTANDLAELCGANPKEPAADAKINFCHGFAQGAIDVELRWAADKKPFCFPFPNSQPRRDNDGVRQLGASAARSSQHECPRRIVPLPRRTVPVQVTRTVAATFNVRPPERVVIADALGDAARPVYLTDLDDAGRASALREATAILARDTDSDLRPGEARQIQSARLIQFMTAGIDFVDLDALPASVPVASNGGAYAGPMAEHGLAMVLAAAKRLLIEHGALSRGEFNQFTRNRTLIGKVCGVLGFGGIGVATARLMRAMGMSIHAINRRGHSDEPTDWMSTVADLDALLAASDVLIISTPLTKATRDLIGERELDLMKPDAILVNLARGEIIQEAPLFAHLRSRPNFFACIDAWWVEPVRHGAFRVDHPFLTLPNVVGSPHNSASVPGMTAAALRRAIVNIKRALAGEMPHYVVGPEERT